MKKSKKGEKLNKKRNLRIAALIQRSFPEILSKLQLSHITISAVQVSVDLKFANVYVISSFGDEISFSSDIIQDMENNSSVIRKKIAKNLQLRFVPKIRFLFDKSFDEFDKINNLIKKQKQIEKT